MGLNLFQNRIVNKIETIGNEVQALINAEFKKVNDKPKVDSPLNQAGMKDGLDIINEYNSVGEYGIAFDHVLYMIHETDISISESSSVSSSGILKANPGDTITVTHEINVGTASIFPREVKLNTLSACFGEVVEIEVTDQNSNTDPNNAETITVTVTIWA